MLNKKQCSHLISVFVFALLPFNRVSVEIRHHQRGRRTSRFGWKVLCFGLGLLLSTGWWLQPLGHFCFLLTHCRQGVKKPSRIEQVLLTVSPRQLCDVFMSRLFRWPQSGLLAGRFAGQVRYPGLLARQGVGVFLW